MSEVFILSAVRTPIGSLMGSLAKLAAPQLGAAAVREAVARAGVRPEQADGQRLAASPLPVDEVILGNVLGAGLGQAPARQAAIGAGLPASVGAFCVNKVCGSGLKAAMLATTAIRAGEAQLVVAGGMESMSNAPYLLPNARKGLRLGHGELLDSLIHDGLWDSFHRYHMGMTGELVAERFPVSREESDRYAAASNEKALRAIEQGAFDAEIVPVTVGDREVSTDEGPRASSPESLAALKPAFREGGTITAGNASRISDGAAALVLASGRAVASFAGVRPLARVVATATHSGEPDWVMMAPAPAVRTVLEKAGLSLDRIDLFEINEPFAAAAVALGRDLQIPPERMNICGGAVALGHPIGATGARILVTLLHSLHRTGGRFGLAALCLGGGEAVAMVVERV
jgi:acetyl-CoA C-acetyltransferase